MNPQPGRSSRPGVVIRWLASSERAAARPIWETLEARAGDDAVACSWAWTDAWLSHFGDLVPHRFALGELGGEPCGIALVTEGVNRKRGPFRVRTVHLGTAGEPPGETVYVEYNRVRVEPEHRPAFAARLVDELRDEPGWHELRLDGFAPDEAEDFLAAEPLLESWRMDCPVMDLRNAGSADGAVLGALKSGARRKVRRSLEALGELETEWAATGEQALDIFAELVELHQQRWNASGQPGAFASARVRGFHRELIPQLQARGAAVLFRVRAAEGTVGCLYHFVERRRVLFYQSGLASYSNPRISPGFVAFTLCMQACCDRALCEYDFMAGDARYKRELSTTTRQLVWARGQRPALRWRVMDRLAAIRRPDE